MINKYELAWKPPACYSRMELSGDVKKWLLDPGSFTKKITDSFKMNTMRITVLQEGLTFAKMDSTALRCFNCRYIYTREVNIFLDNHLIMYAKSILPKSAMPIYKNIFRGLSQKALGHVLFSSVDFTRSSFEVAKILPSWPEFNLAVHKNDSRPPYLWGRRSLFSTEQPLILLTEIFSPGLIRLIDETT